MRSRGAQAVILYTDSQYVMDGIREWLPNWKKRGWKTAARKPVKNQDLWQALDAAAERHADHLEVGPRARWQPRQRSS